jgi:hypothetical protein
MSTGNLLSFQSSGTQTASKLVKTGFGICGYVFATASTSLIIQVFDGTDPTGATGTNLTGQITLAAGTRYSLDLGFSTGLAINVVSGSGSYFVGYV